MKITLTTVVLFFISVQSTKIEKIKITSFRYSICQDCSSSRDTLVCEKWKKTNKLEVIQSVVNKMRFSHAMEVHDNYNSYKCVIEGKCTYMLKRYQYQINAGGEMYLFTSDSISNILVAPKNDPVLKRFFFLTRP